MTNQHLTLRPAMTAIAAVIALSTAPAFAQSVETTPLIVDAAPAPTDPLAPEPTVTTTPEPVASETVTTTPPAEPAPKTARARPAATRSTAVARPVTVAPVAALPAAEALPAPLPIAPEAAIAAPVAEPAPVAQAPLSNDGMSIDEAVPIAGAAGLGLLAMLGAGFVMRRRRRRVDDAIEQAKWQHIEAQPEAAIEPAPTFVRAPQSDPVPVAAATAATVLPSGFDVSKFGRHVQAAYHGPSADNPSASLKRRLTVGHFLDKKEAEAPMTTPVREPITANAPPAAAKPVFATGDATDFMFRRSETRPTLRPAFQK